MAAGREMADKYAPWVGHQRYMSSAVSQRHPLGWSLLPAATPAQKCTPYLLLLFPTPSASSQGHLKSLSILLLSSKTFCRSHHLEGILQIPCPSPSFPFFQPNPSVLQPHLEPSFGELLPSVMLPPPFLFAYVHFRRAFKNCSNSTSSRKPSMNFPTPPCYHPSLACFSTYITYTNIRHFIMVALHCHYHLLTRQI